MSHRALSLRLYTVLLVVWAGAFFFELLDIFHWIQVLQRRTNRLETLSGQLLDNHAAFRQLISDIRAQSEQLTFVQSLDILPKDKGYIRTQQAIANEVQALRHKVGRRIGEERSIAVDSQANKLYFRKGLTTLWEADCSVGRGGILLDRQTGRRWEFVTPRGEFRIQRKILNPVWTMPDWAFVEQHQHVPAPEDEKRKVQGELGAYALSLGDGYLIHGTKNEQVLGRPVSHGCVRLGADNLKRLYEEAPVGTRVYIY